MTKYNIMVINSNGSKDVPYRNMSKAEADLTLEALKRDFYERAGFTENDFTFKVVRQMTQREHTIMRLVNKACDKIVYPLINDLSDNDPESDEYKEALAALNHDSLFTAMYDYVMNQSSENDDSHIRFSGKKFIAQQIENALTECGYGKAA